MRFEWIPRAENKDADALSNVAMDGRVVDRTFGGPSEVDDVPGEPEADDQPRRTGFDRRGTPTRVVLVRHGVTDFTAQGRLDGRGGPDPRLNATGRAQAVAAGRAVASLVQGHPDPGRHVVAVAGDGDRRGRAPRPSASTRWSTPSGTSSPSATGTAARSTELVEGERDAMRALRDDAGLPAARVASRTTTSSRGSCRRGSGSSPRAAPPSSSATASRSSSCSRTCSGCRTTAPGALAAAPGSLTAVEVWDDGEVSVAFTNRT